MSKLLIDYFEKAAVGQAQHAALLLEDGRTFSYERLNEISNSLAKIIAFAIFQQERSELPEEGGTETPLVSVMMSRNLSVIASILAILKCGAAYVPVDPTFPPDRQAYIFSQSNCPLLLTDKDSYAQGRCIMRCTM
jgi:non-ribosomal peptide synthetase component F